MSKISVPDALLHQIKDKAWEDYSVKLDLFRLDHLVRLYICHVAGRNYKIFINMNHKPVLYVQGGNYGTCRDYKEKYKPIEDLARNLYSSSQRHPYREISLPVAAPANPPAMMGYLVNLLNLSAF